MAKRQIAAMKGETSAVPRSERHSQKASAAVTIGTGERKAMLGQANQRAAISGSASGVQMLTIATAPPTPMKQRKPQTLAQAWSSPSVFRMSQQAPSKP